MKKLFQNQVVAWVVLILAVALACLWGYNRKYHYEARKTTELLDVKYYQWIADDAKLLSDSTEKTVTQYDTDWNNKYYAVVAVATLNKLSGWTEDDYARALGEKWGLGAGDMLLLLVKGDDWYVALGDNVAAAMTDTQQTKLKQAIDQPYYAGNYDEAVTAFFRSMAEEVIQEFRLMSELKGTTNIVSCEDHAVVPHTEGVGWDIFIRMELLTPMLRYMSGRELTRGDVIRLGIDICKALELCQKYNIIHRDIKPENIFVARTGDYKLGDFGVARTLEKTTGGL